MSAPKTAFLSSDLLRETRTLMGSEDVALLHDVGKMNRPFQATMGAAATALLEITGPVRERLYLRYGSKVLETLEAAAGPLSDREMFERIRDGEFAQFRIALAELVQRGLIHPADRDPIFADQRYILTPPAA